MRNTGNVGLSLSLMALVVFSGAVCILTSDESSTECVKRSENSAWILHNTTQKVAT